MLEFYTCVILLVNQSEEIDEKQLLDFGYTWGQISPLMHVPLCFVNIISNSNFLKILYIFPSYIINSLNIISYWEEYLMNIH